MTGAPLFFIHGMWSTPAAFTGLRARLEAKGHYTVAPVLPFHDRAAELGASPELGRIGVEDYVAFLVDEIARLPVKPVIAGHSMGGFLAQAVAARVGAPGLILFAPAASVSTGVVAMSPVRTLSGVMTRRGWWEQPTLIDAERARWGIFNEVPPVIAEAEIAALVWDSGPALFELALPWLAKTRATRVDYARLTMPALVVVGDCDRITPSVIARSTARRLAGRVDYHELPATGHWLWHGTPEEVVAGLTGRWLDGLPGWDVKI